MVLRSLILLQHYSRYLQTSAGALGHICVEALIIYYKLRKEHDFLYTMGRNNTVITLPASLQISACRESSQTFWFRVTI